MSIQERIAKSILSKHKDYMIGSGWSIGHEKEFGYIRPTDYSRVNIKLRNIDIECMIADTIDLQYRGLQGHESLGQYEGMLFTNLSARKVAFHAGDIQFPIDIVFIGDDNRISKIVENIDNTTSGSWGMSHVIATLEVNGGFCRAHNIVVGDEVFHVLDKQAQVNLQNIRPVSAQESAHMTVWTMTDGFKVVQLSDQNDMWLIKPDGGQERLSVNTPQFEALNSINGWDMINPTSLSDSDEIAMRQMLNVTTGDMDKQAQEVYPRFPRKDTNLKMLPQINPTLDRFRDRDMIDQQLINQPIPTEHWKSQDGYDQTRTDDEHLEDNIAPTRPSR